MTKQIIYCLTKKGFEKDFEKDFFQWLEIEMFIINFLKTGANNIRKIWKKSQTDKSYEYVRGRVKFLIKEDLIKQRLFENNGN